MIQSKAIIALDVANLFQRPRVKAKQDDTARIIELVLTDNGTAIPIPRGTTAKVRATKPDGLCVLNNCVINADTSSITVQLTEQMLAVAGIEAAEITLYGESGEVLTSTTFYIDIDPSAYDECAIESTIESSALKKLITNEHAHLNKKTLDGLYCQEAESAFSSGSTDDSYLKYNGAPLRPTTDGAVVSEAVQITKNGKTYLRLTLNQEPIGIHNLPNYIDIPVDSVETVTEIDENTGFQKQAAELDLGGAGADATINGVNALTVKGANGVTAEMSGSTLTLSAHEHTNMSKLNKIFGITNDAVGLLNFFTSCQENLALGSFDGAAPAMGFSWFEKYGDDYTKPVTTELYPGWCIDFNNISSITITSFEDYHKAPPYEDDIFEYYVKEYLFNFTCGETPTALSLPASVQWANELEIEPNKRYQVSIVDDIGLWVATDVEASA